jgi:hypothetical protein
MLVELSRQEAPGRASIAITNIHGRAPLTYHRKLNIYLPGSEFNHSTVVFSTFFPRRALHTEARLERLVTKGHE